MLPAVVVTSEDLSVSPDLVITVELSFELLSVFSTISSSCITNVEKSRKLSKILVLSPPPKEGNSRFVSDFFSLLL